MVLCTMLNISALTSKPELRVDASLRWREARNRIIRKHEGRMSLGWIVKAIAGRLLRWIVAYIG
jgi:hypothetical protein